MSKFHFLMTKGMNDLLEHKENEIKGSYLQHLRHCEKATKFEKNSLLF